MRISVISVSTAFILGFNFQSVFAAPPPQARPGKVSVIFETQYFDTVANLNDRGDRVSLFQDNSYQNVTAIADILYEERRGWQFGLGGGLSYASSDDPYETRTNSEFTDVHVYMRKIFNWGKFRLIPETNVSVAVVDIQPNQETVMTNEGVNTYSVGTWARLQAGRIAPYGYLGFQHRDERRSGLLPWAFGVQSRYRIFKGAVELGGSQSVIDDKDNSRPGQLRRFTTNERVNGGSLRYYSVNPSFIEARVYAETELQKKFRIGAMGGYIISGENTAMGYTLGLSLALALDSYSIGIRPQSAGATEDPTAEFQPDVEDADNIIETSP